MGTEDTPSTASPDVDVERLRQETPGCRTVTHLDNAGAALPPAAVVDTVVAHLRREAEIGGYPAAAEASGRIESTYGALARLVGAHPDEIALVENATRAWDMAFYGIRFREGDRILTAQAEYASNVIPFLQVATHRGVRVEVVPDDENGTLDVGALESMLDERVRLIALTHVPTQNGLVNPAAEVGRLAREAGVLYLLDACQSVGQLRVDVREIGCDLLSATGRKFLRGPRGTGFLYCARRVGSAVEPPFLDLHAAEWTGPDEYAVRKDARRFETWEGNVAGKIGLGVAAEYALDVGLDAVAKRVRALADRLRVRLSEVHGVTVHDRGAERCGIVTFTVAGHESRSVAGRLAAERVNVSVSGRGSALWDFDAHRMPTLVRASVHYYNTDDELDRAARVVAGMVNRPPG